jgi:hypothetical protein
VTEESAADVEDVPGSASAMPWPRFVVRWAASHDGFDLRYAGVLAKVWVRAAYRIGTVAVRIGVTPVALVLAALVAALLVPIWASRGGHWPWLAALLMVLGMLADAVADAVGVLTADDSRLTSVYRTLVDRVSELCWLFAAWLLGGAAALVVACAVLAALHEYVRLRATTAGMRPAGSTTVGDRSTRVAVTLVALVVAAAAAGVDQDLAAGTTTVLLAGWTLLALFGLVQLLDIVRKTLR